MLDDAKNGLPAKMVSNIAGEVALMEHTGGTTGTPEAVCLTNKNVNAVVQQYDLGVVYHSNKEKWLYIAFPYLIGSV